MAIRLDDFIEQSSSVTSRPNTTAEPLRGVRLDDFLSTEKRNIEGGLFELTPEREAELVGRGPIGYVEQLRRTNKLEMLPGVGTYNDMQLLMSFKRFRNGQYDDDNQRLSDEEVIGNYLQNAEEERVRGFSLGGQIARGQTALPSYMIEFALTGGMATAGKTFAKKGLKIATGAAIRTALLPHRVAENYAERQIEKGLQFTDKGIQIAESIKEAPFTSFAKAIGDTYIEMFSEETGGMIQKGLGKFVPIQFKTAMEKVFSRLHPNEAVSKLWTKSGYNGFIGEIGEEQVGNILRALTGVEDYGADDPGNVFDRVTNSFFNAEELLVTAGVLALPGVGFAGLNQVLNTIQKRKESSKEKTPPLAELSDDTADKITGTVISGEPTGDRIIDSVKPIVTPPPDTSTSALPVSSPTIEEGEEGMIEGVVEPAQMEELTRNTISEFRVGEDDAEGLDIENLIIEGKPRKEIFDRAKKIRESENAGYTESKDIIKRIKAEIGQFRIDSGNADIREELLSIPDDLRGKKGEGVQFDIFAQNLRDAAQEENSSLGGLIPPDASVSEIIDILKTLKVKRRHINEFIPDAKRQIIQEMQGQTFTRVQPGIKKSIRIATQQEREEPKTITERQALQRSLIRQAQAAAGAEKATKARLRETKSSIRDHIMNLPMSERGRFNSALVTAETPKDVAKVAVRIYNRLNEVIHSDLEKQIRQTADRLIDSERIDVQYRERIKALVDSLQFRGVSDARADELRKTKEFIDREKAAGRNVDMPERIYRALRILERKPITELNLKELVNLLNKINLLENLGRNRLINRDLAYRQEKNRIQSELVAGTVPIEKKALIEKSPGEKMSVNERLSNMITRAQNEARRIDLVISTSDVVFDVLDGNARYEGVNSRVIKQTLDSDFGNYLETKNEWTVPVQEIAAKEGMTDENFQRIGIYAYKQQDGGINYLLNEGLSQEEIDSVELTHSEMRVYQAMREKIELPYQDALDLLRELYNRAMGKIKNYFPVQVDFDKMSDIEIFQRVGDLMDEGSLGRRRKNVEQGSTEERRGTEKRIRLNAMDVFTRHMDDMAYFIEMQRDIKILSEVVNSPAYQKAAGEIGGLWVSRFMDLMARKGGVGGHKNIQALDTLRRNFGSAMLGFKLSSILIQPTALFDGAAQIGGGYVSQGMQRVITEKPWRDFLAANFPELKDRGADDPAYLDLSNNRLMRGVQNAGFSALKKADIITASAVVAGAYQKSLDNRGIDLDLSNPDSQAIKEATAVLRRTQSSPFFKDVPQAISAGGLTGNKSFDKALLQFKSFMLTRWSQIRHHMWRAGFRDGNSQQGAETAFWLGMATLAETGIRVGSKATIAALAGLLVGGFDKAWDNFEDEFDEEWESIGSKLLLEAINNIPFVGDLVNLGRYQGTPIPSFRTITDFPAGVAQAGSGKDRNSRIRGTIKAIGSAAAAVGIPGTFQVEQLLRESFSDDSKKPLL